MNTQELAIYAAKIANIDIKKAQQVIWAIAPAVALQLKKGGSVRLGSLGTFQLAVQKARTYKDVKTGQTKTKPKIKVVKFRVARSKRIVN